MVAKCFVCSGKNPRICFPTGQRLLQKWLLVLKCQVLNHLVYYKLLSLLINLLATTFCGESWPKTLYPALQGGSEEAIIKTRVGIRLKSNVIPMLGVQSQKEDFRDDIEVISGDGNSFKFIKQLYGSPHRQC